MKETPTPFRAFGPRDFDRIPQLAMLPRADRDAMKAVAAVFPFRVNSYVTDELIRWEDVPDDPIFQLTFPQPGMLDARDFTRLYGLVRHGASRGELRAEAHRIQLKLNPHPGGQMELNVPRLGDQPLPGMQHKYRETVLFFPAQGQTCHSYCTYCFRWAQFVGVEDFRFANRQAESLVEYLGEHPEVTSVLFTGGDPLVMKTKLLRRYVEPLLAADLPHLTSIRIGTKAPAYWPQRLVTDDDADDLLALFEEVRARGKHLALMAHFSHPRELETAMAERAVRRAQDAGAVIRCQAPLIRHVNDDATAWADMWRRQVGLGAVPYYMFVERDTGARRYFEVPLAEALDVFNDAYREVTGLARTVRGPSMSATPGKICVNGVTDVGGQRAFVLQYLQARESSLAGQVFFAKYDARACWIDELEPLSRSTFPHDSWQGVGDPSVLAEVGEEAI